MPDLGPFVIAGLSTGAVYVLAGVGLVVLYRASGVLNLAQGALGALSALLAWQIADSGFPQWLGWMAAVAASTALALLYGRLIAPRLAHSDPIVRAVATLGFALIILGFCEFIWGEWPRSLRLPTDTVSFALLGVRVTATRAIAFGLGLAVAIGMMLFLNLTRLGLSMRALANDREISGLVGVPVLRVDAWAWVISGVLSGVSGIFLGNMVRLQVIPLTYMVIPAVAAAIIGRLTSLTAVVIGGLVIGVLEAVASPFPEVSAYRSATPFVVAGLALLWYQRGGLTLSRMDQFRSVATSHQPPNSLWQELRVGIVLAIIVAIAVPYLASAYWLKTFTGVTIIALCSLSVAVLYAQLGMVSLCQYALFGVGGWVALRLYHGFHIPFEIDLLAGGIAASVFGVIFGLPALRMRGLYFALITLMIAAAFQVFINAIGFPDGGPGWSGKVYAGVRQYMPHPPLAPSDAAYFRYVVGVVAIGFALVMLVQRTRAGRAWALIRRSEPVAVAMGVNIVAYKVVAFAIAGFFAGVAGALMAANIGQLDGRAFPASDSIMMFALTVIGGAFHWSGPIFAGLLLRAVPGLLTDRHIDGNLATMVFGAGLLHALITAPQGVSGQVVALGRTIGARLSAAMPKLMERKL
ncbi:MAG: ABC transporter permease [Xanthobacteraceae bacterium]|jgi:branched-subunit amino acid ABC-type transport system permease component